VTQGASSVESLRDLREFFAVGQVVANKRYDNHREHLYRYVVRRREDLLDRIIPYSGGIPCERRSSRTSSSSPRA
jgi:hypothetical protein